MYPTFSLSTDTAAERFHKMCKAQLCPYCDGRPSLVDGSVIYGTNNRYGNVWLCRCGAYVGCHPGTDKPLGRVADKELRYWKMQAHKMFDPLWMEKARRMGGSKKHYHTARLTAYSWLGKQLHIKPKHTHIGMFDVEQCKKVIELCKDYFKQAA